MAPSDIEQDATAVGLAPWVADPLAMSPLLIAYDERLNELQSSNTVLTEQVGKLKKSNDDVQAENGSLRADLKHYVERMLSYTEGSNGGLGGASTTSSRRPLGTQPSPACRRVSALLGFWIACCV